MESELIESKDLSSEEVSITTSSRKLTELKAIHESESLRHSLAKKELISEILNAVTDCANFRDYVQTQLKDLKTLHEERLDMILVKINGVEE